METDDRRITAELWADRMWVPLAQAVVERSCLVMGLAPEQIGRLTMAVEEIVMHLVGTSPGTAVSLEIIPGGWHVTARLSFTADPSDLWAMNFSAGTRAMVDPDLPHLGLVLAARMTDRFSICLDGGTIRLSLRQDFSYPSVEPPPASPTNEKGDLSIDPDPESALIKAACIRALGLYRPWDLHQSFFTPGKLADMVARKDMTMAVALTREGEVAGAVCWQARQGRGLTFFGPYTFEEGNRCAARLIEHMVQLVPPHVQAFSPYYPSKPDSVLMQLYGVDHLHRLNNNENALGPPPAAAELVAQFQAGAVPVYPNGDCHDLRQVLAQRLGKGGDQFLVGNGSCEVIASVIKAFCAKGDNIITADKTFAVYEWVAEFSGLEARLIPLRDQMFDAQAMLDAMDRNTKILFVCNPNNPTGTYWDRDTMTGFLDEVDNRAVVVIDEAYFEYVEAPDFPDGMELLDRYPNVVVFRTFSKMCSLAALRIGYLAASPEMVELIRRTHIVYSVNTLAQQAAAAALSDDGSFIARTRTMVAAARTRLSGLFEEMCLAYVSHQGNYIMVRLPVSDTLMYRRLMTRGIMVRIMTGFRFPNWIRISLVQAEVMEEFCTVFAGVMAEMAFP